MGHQLPARRGLAVQVLIAAGVVGSMPRLGVLFAGARTTVAATAPPVRKTCKKIGTPPCLQRVPGRTQELLPVQRTSAQRGPPPLQSWHGATTILSVDARPRDRHTALGHAAVTGDALNTWWPRRRHGSGEASTLLLNGAQNPRPELVARVTVAVPQRSRPRREEDALRLIAQRLCQRKRL
jgi:hypothetical protein